MILFYFPFIIKMDQVKEDEMGRACTAHEGDKKCVQNSC
jgi:hypothetical protein